MRNCNKMWVLLAIVSVVSTSGWASAQGSNPCGQQANNSGQLVTPALQAIDDKSPMASSINTAQPSMTPQDMIALRAATAPVNKSSATFTTHMNFIRVMQDPQAPTASIQQLRDQESLSNLTPPEEFLLGPEGKRHGDFVDDNVRLYTLVNALKRAQHGNLAAQQSRTALKPEFDAVTSAVEKSMQPLMERLRSLNPVDVIGAAIYAAARVYTQPVTQVYQRIELSDGLYGYDVVGEAGDSNPHSLSLGMRFDVSPTRYDATSRIARFARYIIEERNYRRSLGNGPVDDAHLIENGIVYSALLLDAKKAAVERAQSLHVGLSSGYTTVNGAGSIFAYGLSASAVKALHGYDGAFTLLGTVQQASILSHRPGSTDGIIPGAALMWQDSVSSLDKTGLPTLRRWRTQFGLEYVSLASFAHAHDMFDAFFRKRLRDYTEIKLTAGVDAANSARFGFEIGHTFKLPRSENNNN